jgi:hypothetical protein
VDARGRIGEAVFLHVFWTINVPKVDHHRASHQISDSFKIKCPELLPLGDDYNGVGFLYAVIGIPAINDVS